MSRNVSKSRIDVIQTEQQLFNFSKRSTNTLPGGEYYALSTY